MAKKQNFLQGALVLAIGVALVKIIGAVFKIPLGNLLDGNGFANFNIAYSVYNVLLVISTAGLPVAVSKMVAEANATGQGGDVKKIFRAAMSTFLIIGFVGSALMFIFAEPIAADLMNSPKSVHTIRVIAPASFFVAVMSVFRGYYQGQMNMVPTALSQIIEALSKLVFGIIFASLLINAGYGQEIAAAGAIAGVTIGTVLGAVFLILRRAFDRRNYSDGPVSPRTQGEITKSLLAIAIPITIGSGVLAITNLIDSALVLGRLSTSAGFTQEQAEWMYGSYGLAQTLFNFPSAFIVPFSTAIVPAIASALAKHDQKTASRTIETGMRVTGLLALPAAAGLSVLAGPILHLLFPARVDEAAAATIPLNILAIAVFFNCVVMLSNSTLQSIGKVRVPVYTMLCGSAVKIVANWILVGTPSININGAPIGTCLCYCTIMVLNMIVISKHIKPAPNVLRMFGRPMLATLVMAAAAWAASGLLGRFLPNSLTVLLSVGIAVVVYFVCILLMKAVTREDLSLIPKGEKIANLLRLK